MQVIVQDLATHYSRAGKGKPVVLLHGWGDSSVSWQPFAKKLADTYDVIVPDLPGFGATESPHGAWSVTEYAQFVRDFLQKLDVKSYAVIGHSNGGAIAVRGIGQGMFQADRLVLLASAGVRSPRVNQGFRIIAKVGKVVARPLPQTVRRRLRSTLYQKAGSDMLVAEHMQETFKKIVRDDVRGDAAYLSLPTLLLYGDDDQETPMTIGRQLHEAINGSRLQVLQGSGHFVQLDAADEVERMTREFLRG